MDEKQIAAMAGEHRMRRYAGAFSVLYLLFITYCLMVNLALFAYLMAFQFIFTLLYFIIRWFLDLKVKEKVKREPLWERIILFNKDKRNWLYLLQWTVLILLAACFIGNHVQLFTMMISFKESQHLFEFRQYLLFATVIVQFLAYAYLSWDKPRALKVTLALNILFALGMIWALPQMWWFPASEIFLVCLFYYAFVYHQL